MTGSCFPVWGIQIHAPVYFLPHSHLHCDFYNGENHTDSNSEAHVHQQENVSSYPLCTISLSRPTAPPGYTVGISAPFTPHFLSSVPITKLLLLPLLFLEIPISFSKLHSLRSFCVSGLMLFISFFPSITNTVPYFTNFTLQRLKVFSLDYLQLFINCTSACDPVSPLSCQSNFSEIFIRVQPPSMLSSVLSTFLGSSFSSPKISLLILCAKTCIFSASVYL